MSAPAADNNRRAARRLAVCGVYSMEVTGQSADRTLMSLMAVQPEEEFGWPDDNRWPDFAKELVRAVEANSADIEREVQAALENWRMDRVSPVERAILKLGCAEIFHFDDIPPKVTINEYIELAKEYANDNAPPFVNGVLDRLAQVKKKPDFTAPRVTRAAPPRAKHAPLLVKPALPASPSPFADPNTSFIADPKATVVPANVASFGAASQCTHDPSTAVAIPDIPPPASANAAADQPSPADLPVLAPHETSLTLASAGMSLADLLPSPPAPRAEVSMVVDLAKVNSRWAREIAVILSSLGGRADLVMLCERIESRGMLDLGDQWRRTVLDTLERHSAASAGFDGTPGDIHANLFAHVGPMEWGLKNPIAPGLSDTLTTA